MNDQTADRQGLAEAIRAHAATTTPAETTEAGQ